MNATPVIVLTRPLGSSNRLMTALRPLGYPLCVCPTLRIETLPADASHLDVLKQIDLVFFVSGAAVRSMAEQLARLGLVFPSSAEVAAVGQSTASEIVRVLGREDVVLPVVGETEDSESLLKFLLARGRLPRHVLIVRGQNGREWFADQLRQLGVQVSVHAAYCRTQATWDDNLVGQLKAYESCAAMPVIVCTSEQGITALVRLVRQHGLYSWCRNGRFVVTHQRHLVALATQFMFNDAEKNIQIHLSGIQDDDILETIRLICHTSSCL